LHVARDVGAKRANGVRQCGNAKAGMKFLGDGAATDYFSALEDERLESALGEIKRGHQRIVTATDEHHVLSDGHGQFFSRLCDEGEADSTAGSGTGGGTGSTKSARNAAH